MNNFPSEKIDKLLVKMGVKNTVFYTFILPSFTFCKKEKAVVAYNIGKNDKNDLVVLQTISIDLDKEGGFEKYINNLKLKEKDILVFCVNNEYLKSGNQIRVCHITDL